MRRAVASAKAGTMLPGCVLSVCFLAFALSSHADTHYVSTTGIHNAPYTNWVDAATNIQSAINLATNGDTVLVAAGTYCITNTISIKKAIHLRGNGEPDETIIDAGGVTPCLELMHSNAAVSAVTLQNGYGRYYGGLWLHDYSEARDCIIQDCVGDLWAGGVFARPGSHIERCVVRRNEAVVGYPADHSAGGLFLHGRALNCLIYGNTAELMQMTDDQGASGCLVSGGELLNSTVSVNGSPEMRLYPGLCIIDEGVAINCIAFFNANAGGEKNWQTVDGGRIDYSCTRPMPPDPVGDGNITDNPMFADVFEENYRLLPASPCIDAGTNSVVAWPTDLDGIDRVVDGNFDGTNRVDMGAYENNPTTYDSDGDGLTDGAEVLTYGTSPTNGNTDGDQQSDYEEMVADTDGANSNDYFCITAISNISPVSVHFESSSGRQYRMASCSNLVHGTWTNVPGAGPRMGVGGPDQLLDTNEPPRGLFYRVDVALP